MDLKKEAAPPILNDFLFVPKLVASFHVKSVTLKEKKKGNRREEKKKHYAMPCRLVYTLSAVLESIIAMTRVSKMGAERMGGAHVQSCVVASKGLGNQIRLDKLLGLVGAQMKLETLPQGTRRRGHANREARHFGLAAHHGHQVDNVVCRATKS